LPWYTTSYSPFLSAQELSKRTDWSRMWVLHRNHYASSSTNKCIGDLLTYKIEGRIFQKRTLKN